MANGHGGKREGAGRPKGPPHSGQALPPDMPLPADVAMAMDAKDVRAEAWARMQWIMRGPLSDVRAAEVQRRTCETILEIKSLELMNDEQLQVHAQAVEKELERRDKQVG